VSKTRDDVVGGAGNTMGELVNLHEILVSKLEGRDHFEDLGMVGMTILYRF
jgi:hypothetical protein